MDVLLEYKEWLILPALILLAMVARRGRRESQPPAPVAPVQPQQPVAARDHEGRLDKFVWIILIIAVVFLGFMFLTDPSEDRIPDIAVVQRVLTADSIGTLFVNWNTLTGNPDGSKPIGSGTALVMIVFALIAFILGRGSKRGDA